MDTKLVGIGIGKTNERQRTIVKIGSRLEVGGKSIVIIGGPCAVESAEQMEQSAAGCAKASVQMLRGGVYKPRTSPYSFQGLGADGIEILAGAGRRHNLPVVTEVMAEDQIDELVQSVDCLQVGSRNMQNFNLLKALGRAGKPVILKRGLSATIEEFLLAAEYIAAHGNEKIILCERGIRSFDSYTRNVLDLGAVVALKQLTHLPVIADPSHAAGKSELVADLARAAIACGADGVMVECHPRPAESVSDARQALSLDEMGALVSSLRPVAAAVGRAVPERRIVSPVVSIMTVRSSQTGKSASNGAEPAATERRSGYVR